MDGIDLLLYTASANQMGSNCRDAQIMKEIITRVSESSSRIHYCSCWELGLLQYQYWRTDTKHFSSDRQLPYTPSGLGVSSSPPKYADIPSGSDQSNHVSFSCGFLLSVSRSCRTASQDSGSFRSLYLGRFVSNST